MKTTLPFLASLLLASQVAAQEIPALSQTSKIERVTVFSKGAQITRTAEVDMQAGKQKLVFSKLSPYLNPSSIRVKTEGDFTLLSVNHRRDFMAEQEENQVIQALKKEASIIKDSLELLQTFKNVLKAEQELLKENRQIKGEATGITLENLQGIAEYYGKRMRTLSVQMFQLDQEYAEMGKRLKKVSQQLEELNAQRTQPDSEIVLTVECKKAASAKIELSYFVVNAGWTASYDLRAEEINQPIRLLYKANVFQQSGEDWKNVKLSFSNATPNESGSVPTLDPNYLNFSRATQPYALLQPATGGQISGRVTESATGEPLIGASVYIPGTNIGTVTDLNGNYTLNAPPDLQQIEVSYVGFENQRISVQNRRTNVNIALNDDSALLDEVVVTAMASGVSKARPSSKLQKEALPTKIEAYTTSVQFDLEIPFSIPSDGEMYTLEIDQFDMPSQFEYRSVPKKEESAYLMAQISDWKDYNLLPGESNLYFESTYVGKSYLDTRFAGDTLLLSLGKDQNIQINRERVKQFSKRQFIGSNQKETARFRIWVRNNKSVPVQIQVLDQIPVSQLKDIDVEVEELSGGKLNETTGQIDWTLELDPGGEQELFLQFTVKYPKDRYLVID